MAEAQDEKPPYHQREFAHQFLFLLKSGRGQLVWGDEVKESDGQYTVVSSDGAVIQLFRKDDVESWKAIPDPPDDERKPTGSESRSSADAE